MFREKKYFISIGAGKNQLPLISGAKKLGFDVIGVDQDPQAPGLFQCNIRLIESSYEYRKIYHKLLEYPLNGIVVGVGTRSFGLSGKTVAYLAQKFQLRGNSYEGYERFMDKGAMRRILHEAEIPVPDFISLDKKKTLPASSKWPLPWIAKKKESHGKMGNYFLTHDLEAQRFFASVEKKEDYILERYISHKMELTVIGIVNKGAFFLVDIIQKVTTGPPFFIELEHRSHPPLSEELVEQIVEISNNSVKALNISFGPVVIEIIVFNKTPDKVRTSKLSQTASKNSQGKNSDPAISQERIAVLEVIPEFGGEFIAETLAKRKPTYDIFQETIRLLTSDRFNPPKPQTDNQDFFVIQFLALNKNNMIWTRPVSLEGLTEETTELKVPDSRDFKDAPKKYTLLNIQKPRKKAKGLLEQEIFVEPRDEISMPRHNQHRLGYFILKGKDRYQTLRLANNYRDQFKFIVN